MADYISKIQIGDIVYQLKDVEIRAAVEALQTAVSSSLVFKGVVSNATDITELTNYQIGWTYKANANFYFSPFGWVENGDMVICIANYNSEYKDSDWTIVQNNINVMEGASPEQDGVTGLVPQPASASYNKFLRGDGLWSNININNLEQEEEDYILFDCGSATTIID